MERQNIHSGTPWEDQVGYSRAIRVGNVIEVSGTTAVDGRKIVHPGDFYAQTRFILEKIESALQAAGAEMSHVVRTRIFVTDISHWEDVGRAHQEYFGSVKPASTMVEINALVHPDMVVEMEVTAVV